MDRAIFHETTYVVLGHSIRRNTVPRFSVDEIVGFSVRTDLVSSHQVCGNFECNLRQQVLGWTHERFLYSVLKTISERQQEAGINNYYLFCIVYRSAFHSLPRVCENSSDLEEVKQNSRRVHNKDSQIFAPHVILLGRWNLGRWDGRDM